MFFICCWFLLRQLISLTLTTSPATSPHCFITPLSQHSSDFSTFPNCSSLYLLFVSNLTVPTIFPPPLSGAGHSYRARLISPVSQHSGRIPQPGSHQAKLCHNTVRPLCPALLCCCSDVHSWSAAPAVLLLTLMLLTNNWRLLCIVSQHSLVPRWSSERHKGLVG